MIPSQVEERKTLLEVFVQDFRSLYLKFQYYIKFVSLLLPEVLAPYHQLEAMGDALASISYPTTSSFPNRRVSLDKWITRTGKYWENEEKKQRWLTVPEHLHSVDIWENKQIRYWSGVISILDYWWTIGPCSVEKISWSGEVTTVKLTIQGKGKLESISTVAIEKVPREFWILNTSSELIDIPTQALDAEILGAQFLTQQGRGVFIVEVNKNQIAMHLHIPRADNVDTIVLESWPLSPFVAGRVVDKILYLIASGMQGAIIKWEHKLSEELDRLSSISDTEIDLDDALDKLRESFNKLQEVKGLLYNWLADFPGTVE